MSIASGNVAEDMATRFLQRRGLAILVRNYRTRLGEVDVIARDGEYLVFVEVRMRSPGTFGGALESITMRKQRRIIAAAKQYLMRLPRVPPCRFDVISLDGGEPRWLRGAFEAD